MAKNGWAQRIVNSIAGEPDMEENKVREKLANMKLPEDRHASAYPQLGYKWADAILQSQDLRVEIVEPKYQVIELQTLAKVTTGDVTVAIFPKNGLPEQLADEYCDWLNSKEPK